MITVPLRRVARLVNGGTPSADPVNWDGDVRWATPVDLSLVDGGVVGDTQRTLTRAGLDSGSALIPPSGVVLSTRAPIGYLALAGGDLAFNQGCKGLVPLSETDPRFLRYTLQAARARLQALGSGSTFQELSSEGLMAFEVPHPSIEVQRRIADFLDDQVARIDQLRELRFQQRASYLAVLDGEWDHLAEDAEQIGALVPLRRVVRSIADGPFGSALTSAHYSDFGVRVVRLGNIGLSEFRDHDKAFISQEHANVLSSHEVLPGDLVMAGLGDESWPLGRCAVMPDVGPSIVKADCYRIRLDSRVRHDFAAFHLSSPRARARFHLLARGSTRARLNTVVAMDAVIPLVSTHEQTAVVRAFEDLRQANRSAELTQVRAVELLDELKSSLITAAVMGEFDVVTAGRGVPG